MVGVADFDRFVFVVGAPRCGTTTLSRFLKDNPGIAFPAVKEPHYFALNDLRSLSDEALKERVEREYLGRFFAHWNGKEVGADCSVTYLYTPELMDPILRLWPKSRFIIALRDPLTMLPSMHQRLVFMGDENLTTFVKAWRAIPDRTAGKRIPRSCVDPRWLRYDEAAKFGGYVERLFATVGRERCLPVIFDDLSSDPEGQYRQLMDFCGLQPRGDMDFQPQRSGKGVRFHWLQRLLKRPPAAVRNYVATDMFLHMTGDLEDAKKAASRSKILSVRKRLLKWNRIEAPRERIPLEVQQEIRAHLKSEIDTLGELIGRDLSHWLQPKDDRGAPRSSANTRKAAA